MPGPNPGQQPWPPGPPHPPAPRPAHEGSLQEAGGGCYHDGLLGLGAGGQQGVAPGGFPDVDVPGGGLGVLGRIAPPRRLNRHRGDAVSRQALPHPGLRASPPPPGAAPAPGGSWPNPRAGTHGSGATEAPPADADTLRLLLPGARTASAGTDADTEDTRGLWDTGQGGGPLPEAHIWGPGARARPAAVGSPGPAS